MFYFSFILVVVWLTIRTFLLTKIMELKIDLEMTFLLLREKKLQWGWAERILCWDLERETNVQKLC